MIARQPSSRPTPVRLTVDRSGGDDTPRGEAAHQHRATIETYYSDHLETLRTRYADSPNQVGIESQAVCNATCDFCPYPTMTRKGERMSDGLLDKVFADIEDLPRDLPFDINLSRMSEPFADKRVWSVAQRINDRLPHASMWFFTNASPLVPKIADRLRGLERVTQFVISLNEHRPEVYKAVMGLDHARTVANIDNLHRLHDSGALSFTPSITKVGDGTPADDAFLAWSRDRWPNFVHRVTGRFDWRNSVDVRRVGEVPKTGCWQWFHVPILASGRVAYCTLDHEGAHAWGDVKTAHILDIYNQPSRRALRTGIPDRHEVEGCSACSHYG